MSKLKSSFYILISDANAMVTPHIALKAMSKKGFSIPPCFAYANITLLDLIARPAWTIAGIANGTEPLLQTPTSASVSFFSLLTQSFTCCPSANSAAAALLDFDFWVVMSTSWGWPNSWPFSYCLQAATRPPGGNLRGGRAMNISSRLSRARLGSQVHVGSRD